MHNGTIIGTVTERAYNSWIGPKPDTANRELWNKWEKHWIDTGRLWATELRAEGLNKTADTLEKHLAWFERNVK
jgi:hypothetical protein